MSNFGNVRSVQRKITQRGPHGETVTRTIGGRMLSQKRRGQNGYCEVTLKAIGRGVKSQVCLVHRLVLEAFVGPCPEGEQARHFPDRRCTNNRLDNLQWGTPKANQADRIVHGTTVNGERSHLARLSAAQVRDIRRRLGSGERIRAVAKALGIDEATVGHIKHRRSWKFLA